MGGDAASRTDDPILAAARAFERDRYLTALRVQGDARGDLLTLAAFFAELQRIPAFVNEPMMGEIRFQWWRDAVVSGASGGHPIADAVADVVRRRRLLGSDIERLLDAMRLRLDDQPFATPDDLEQHLAATEGAVFHLTAMCLEAPRDDETLAACARAGVAYGLARVAIELPAVLAQGRTLAPKDVTAKFGIETLDSAPREASGALQTGPWFALRRHLADRARAEAAAAKSALHRLPKAVRTACRPLAMVAPYSGLIRRLSAGDGLAVADVLPMTRLWRIWRGI